jgi:hypothetical protein
VIELTPEHLSNISVILGIMLGAYTLLTALIALVTSYALVKFRLKKLEEDKEDIKTEIKALRGDLTLGMKNLEVYFRGLLFEKDTGENILMPRKVCVAEREKCQTTMDVGFKKVSKELANMDKKREDSKSALLALFTKLNETLIGLQAELTAYKEMFKKPTAEESEKNAH